ncbi:preprotein translocase subunit SecE [Candidatus Saccharibacteria bacterium]|nr:preprotein translocase subunit SecE [Candidatus Saccharibacteria bacterium]
MAKKQSEDDGVKIVSRVSVGSNNEVKEVSTTKSSKDAKAAKEAKVVKTEKPARIKNEKIVAGKKPRGKRRLGAPRWLRAIGAYFAGAWSELRQTKWPTRRATWSLTLAVIVFTTALMLFIVAIDYVFDLLFKQIIL